jgi:hypothetical protein
MRVATIVLSLFLYGTVWAKNFTYSFKPNELITAETLKISSISSLGIASQTLNHIPLNELSGLAWDEQKKRLYAVSDSGYLYHFKLSIDKNTLIKTELLQAYKLRDKKGRRFRRKDHDAEGLTLQRDKNGVVTALIISFERHFRIARFSLQGRLLGNMKLPKLLRNKRHFRRKNKGLESVTLHPRYGMITAAELPLKTAPKNYQTLYARHNKVWHFKLSPYRNSAVTGLETLPNGDVLVLERSYNGLFSPMIISLRQVKLSECNKRHQCNVQDIAIFNSVDGWRIDNFEGLTHYKDNQYLMVSDNNKNPLQNTVLVLFTIKK